jgi:Spondin_N
MNWSRLVRSRKFNALTLVAFAVALLLVIALPGKIGRSSDDVRTWRITWTNLTPVVVGNPANSSQPETPPILITHKNSLSIWGVGQIASAGVSDLAQDPNPVPLKNMLSSNPDVYQALIFGAGPTPSGATRSMNIQSSGGADRLDFLSMLANTNDTFTGLSNVLLADQTIDVFAYDAGTERNNWLAAYIPGPCCGHPWTVFDASDGLAQSGELIRLSPGFVAVPGGINSSFGWDNSAPVMRIQIEQVG